MFDIVLNRSWHTKSRKFGQTKIVSLLLCLSSVYHVICLNIFLLFSGSFYIYIISSNNIKSFFNRSHFFLFIFSSDLFLVVCSCADEYVHWKKMNIGIRTYYYYYSILDTIRLKLPNLYHRFDIIMEHLLCYIRQNCPRSTTPLTLSI